MHDTKIIVEDDAITALGDALCDLMLVYGTDDISDPRMQVALATALSSAVNTHYPAEIGGDSDGTPIEIVPIDGPAYMLAERI